MAAHVLIAAALGRRNYVLVNKQALYTNLYCGMVAKPGSGKSQIVKLARQVIRRVNDFQNGTHIYLGNESVSKAALVEDFMAAKLEWGTQPNQPMLTLHELTGLYDELATFMPQYESDKVGLLLKLYDCPEHYRETRVTAEPREINNAFFNFFFGTQPDFWYRLLAFEQEVGIKSRTILCSEDFDIYARPVLEPSSQVPSLDEMALNDELVAKDVFLDPAVQHSLAVLSRDLAALATQTTGVFRFTSAYNTLMNEWWLEKKGEPLPSQLAMGDYPVRRPMHVIKLSAHIAASRGSKELDLPDLEKAFATLFDWEDSTKFMNADLRQSEHGRIMDEAYQFFYSKTVDKHGKISAFSGQDLRKFLSHRVRAVEIEIMVSQMIQSGYIKSVGPTVASTTDLQSVVKFQRFHVNPEVKTKKVS